MVVVTGSNGHLGSATLQQLQRLLDPAQVIASTRGGPPSAASSEVQIRHADFSQPDTLARAFAGASQVLVVSTGQSGTAAVQLHENAARAASAAGARVLYTSHSGAGADSLFSPMQIHAATEQRLAALGTPWTALRNGFYAESALQMLGRALQTGELRAPEDGPVAWTSRLDLAEAAARVLAGQHTFDGPTPPLTATQTLDLTEIAALAQKLTGRPVRRVVVSDAEHRDSLLAAGLPAERVELFLGLFAASRRGEFTTVHPALGQLLGRQPRSLEEVLARHLETLQEAG